MTVRNVRGTIEKCLDSLERQSLAEEFDIVVVDALSCDGTMEFLENSSLSNCRLRVYQRKSSQSEALQLAFRENYVDTEFVAMIDGDAVADINWLAELMKSADSGHDVVGGPCYTPNDVNLLQRLIGYDLDSRFARMSEGFTTRLPNMNLCVRRSIFSEIGFDTSLDIGYDMEFGHRLKKQGRSIWFNPRAIVWHYHRSSFPAYVRQQVNAADYAARVFRIHPTAMKGDNINPLTMLVDAPLLGGFVLSALLASLIPFSLVISMVLLVAFGSSILAKTVESYLRFRRAEVLLLPVVYVLRPVCWAIGFSKGIAHLTRSRRAGRRMS